MAGFLHRKRMWLGRTLRPKLDEQRRHMVGVASTTDTIFLYTANPSLPKIRTARSSRRILIFNVWGGSHRWHAARVGVRSHARNHARPRPEHLRRRRTVGTARPTIPTVRNPCPRSNASMAWT